MLKQLMGILSLCFLLIISGNAHSQVFEDVYFSFYDSGDNPINVKETEDFEISLFSLDTLQDINNPILPLYRSSIVINNRACGDSWRKFVKKNELQVTYHEGYATKKYYLKMVDKDEGEKMQAIITRCIKDSNRVSISFQDGFYYIHGGGKLSKEVDFPDHDPSKDLDHCDLCCFTMNSRVFSKVSPVLPDSCIHDGFGYSDFFFSFFPPNEEGYEVNVKSPIYKKTLLKEKEWKTPDHKETQDLEYAIKRGSGKIFGNVSQPWYVFNLPVFPLTKTFEGRIEILNPEGEKMVVQVMTDAVRDLRLDSIPFKPGEWRLNVKDLLVENYGEEVLHEKKEREGRSGHVYHRKDDVYNITPSDWENSEGVKRID